MEDQMKKLLLAAAILSAVCVPCMPSAAKDSGKVSAEALSAAVSHGFEYKNSDTGISITLPVSRVENKDNNGLMYQAYLPDSGLSLMIMSKSTRQPRMEKKLQETRKASEKFLREKKGDSKETLVSVKKGKVDGVPAIITSSRGTAAEGGYEVLRYWVSNTDGDYMISFTSKEGEMKSGGKTVKGLVDSIHFFTPMQRVEIKGTVYTYDIPANMRVDYKPPVAPDHVLVAGNLSLMTGVTALPIEENDDLSFFPESLAGLTKDEQASIVDHLKAKIADEANGRKVKKTKFDFRNVYGRDALIMDFEDGDSHNRSFIFIQDGKYISFDYIYSEKDKDYAEKVIEQSVKSISL